MNRVSLLIALIIVATSLSAQAQPVVTTNTSWNAFADEAAVFTSTTSEQVGSVTSDATMQQTFTLGGAISAESIRIRYRSGGDLDFAIYQVADAFQPNPLTLGSLVWSNTATLPNAGSNSTSANLELISALALAAGTYAFVIDSSSATSFEWRRTSTSNNTYLGGRAYATGTVTGGGTSFNNGGSDFSLTIVPEPTTVSLVLASLGALYLGMRRRR